MNSIAILLGLCIGISLVIYVFTESPKEQKKCKLHTWYKVNLDLICKDCGKKSEDL